MKEDCLGQVQQEWGVRKEEVCVRASWPLCKDVREQFQDLIMEEDLVAF